MKTFYYNNSGNIYRVDFLGISIALVYRSYNNFKGLVKIGKKTVFRFGELK